MSLHRPTEHGIGTLPARCACGWVGEPVAFYDERDEAYAHHVVEALGPHAYYGAGAACRNCGQEQVASVLVGRPVRSACCERCGVRGDLVPRNPVADGEEVWHDR